MAPSERPWPVPKFRVVGAGDEDDPEDDGFVEPVEAVELGALPAYPLRMPFE